MSKKEIAFLIILFGVFMSLSIAGFFDKISSYSTQSVSPPPKLNFYPTSSPKPFKLPLIKISPTPIPKQIKISDSTPGRPLNTDHILLPTATNSEPETTSRSLGAFGGFGIPFGGKVIFTEGCASFFCGGANELIHVGPPRGGVFAINSTTNTYEFYNWSVGNWVLGLAGGFDICFEQVCIPGVDCICVPVGGGPAVEIIGTSK